MSGWRTSAVVAAAAVVMASVAGGARAADESPWEVRLRAVYLDPYNHSDAVPGLLPSDAIHINNKWLPDLDVEYHFTPHWSSELVLTVPQSQDVNVAGIGRIGSFKHLPPVLTVKYNFLPYGTFRPYVGAGYNLTIISDVNLYVPGVGTLGLNKTSTGPALQAGFDWKLAEHWFLNADVKWVRLHATVNYAGDPVTQLQINPLLFGIGAGYRF